MTQNTPDLVAQQTQCRPDAIAIESGCTTLRYRALGSRAEHLSRRLRDAGIARDSIVAVCLRPSPEFIIAALAAMSAGGAYLALDATYPAERLSFMLVDSGARVLLTTAEIRPLIQVPESVSVILVEGDRDDGDGLALSPVEADLDRVAYLIYTSGSTGQPKGVELTHRGLSNLVAWHNSAFSITHEDRASQVAGLGFDAAVWEIWPYLTAGATICIPGEAVRQDATLLRKWLIDKRVTVAFAPTVMAEQLLASDWSAHGSLRVLLTGGEALRHYPRANLPFTLVNNYGPTECTVVVTSGIVPAGGDRQSPPAIGRPIANTQVHLLDAGLNPVPAGAPGEIYIGGPNVARGYRNQHTLTAERFIPDPFSAAPGARLYRTGDLARAGADGQIEFLGRADDQVKIRGYRIEPDEPAMALSRHPAVRQCVVVVREDDDGKYLAAYLVLNDDVAISLEDVRGFLGRTLPEYMIPAAFVVVDALPMTPNGKVDRAALPAPDPENTLPNDAGALPRTPVEATLASIVKSLLKLDEIGIDDNFFLLGGHSLLGAQLIGRVREQFDVDIQLRALFESPTVASLAAEIERLVLEKVKSMSDDDLRRLYGLSK